MPPRLGLRLGSLASGSSRHVGPGWPGPGTLSDRAHGPPLREAPARTRDLGKAWPGRTARVGAGAQQGERCGPRATGRDHSALALWPPSLLAQRQVLPVPGHGVHRACVCSWRLAWPRDKSSLCPQGPPSLDPGPYHLHHNPHCSVPTSTPPTPVSLFPGPPPPHLPLSPTTLPPALTPDRHHPWPLHHTLRPTSPTACTPDSPCPRCALSPGSLGLGPSPPSTPGRAREVWRAEPLAL